MSTNELIGARNGKHLQERIPRKWKMCFIFVLFSNNGTHIPKLQSPEWTTSITCSLLFMLYTCICQINYVLVRVECAGTWQNDDSRTVCKLLFSRCLFGQYLSMVFFFFFFFYPCLLFQPWFYGFIVKCFTDVPMYVCYYYIIIIIIIITIITIIMCADYQKKCIVWFDR